MARQQLRPQGVGHQRRQHRQVQHGQRLAPAHARHHAHHGVPAVDQHGQPQEGQHRRGAAPGYESEGIVARRLAAGQAHDQVGDRPHERAAQRQRKAQHRHLAGAFAAAAGNHRQPHRGNTQSDPVMAAGAFAQHGRGQQQGEERLAR
ncbi:hypothetical protein G6F50_015287 [Rhizopus delemar]|uniref:Uncharacterized protein n=1 Tax=Rhizopus delemar TaxID=936053 RepID=A0A9P7C4L6_9FUNG|nr:hypothetical protein G6F50_015287 [Rhizopus delemar]